MPDFGDTLDSVFKSYIGRIVAFALAPLLALAVPPVVQFLNEVLGTAYTDQQLSNIAIGTVVGLALVIWQWLRNRGNWENKLAELEALYKAGEQYAAQQPPGGDPVLPLGMDPDKP